MPPEGRVGSQHLRRRPWRRAVQLPLPLPRLQLKADWKVDDQNQMQEQPVAAEAVHAPCGDGEPAAE